MEIKQYTSNNIWVKKEILVSTELKKKFEPNKNENTTFQYVWDAIKAVLRKEFIALNEYTEKKKDVTSIILLPSLGN